MLVVHLLVPGECTSLLCTSTAARLLRLGCLLCFAVHLHGDDSLAHKRGDAAGCVLEGSVVRLGAPAVAQLAHVTLVGVRARARGWGWGWGWGWG